MIFLVNGTNRAQFAADLAQMHRHRKTVFVDQAGWRVPVVADQEIDAYDSEDTIYLLGKGEAQGPLLASVRLLSTMRPHLMADLFAGACRGGPPRGATIWEVSRFCTTPELSDRGARLALLWEIICGVMETALLCEIDQVIFIANRALLPLTLNCGWEAKIIGQGRCDSDDQMTAVAADVSTEGLRQVRQRHGVPIPVLRLHAATVVCAPRQVWSSAPTRCAEILPHTTSTASPASGRPLSLGEHVSG
ncbi:MAG TPA: acyl-homoserine-lactone synthase [Terriglobales bacterium]|nr:acyl-homoserine-lactone synthase [Terriglobales bacterium]